MSQLDITKPLTWVEINRSALAANLRALKNLVAKKTIVAPCVKANAYGHGLTLSAEILTSAKTDWLSVNSLEEALILKKTGICIPIYILGMTPLVSLEHVVRHGFRQVVYGISTISALGKFSKKLAKKAYIHLKVETGTNRQGILENELERYIKEIHRHKNLVLEGISMHFANIEDTQNPRYAKFQLDNFRRIIARAEFLHKGKIPMQHCANSASVILYPETHLNMVRPGIAVYGLWPSKETKKATAKKRIPIKLKPVLEWKTKIAQIKEIPKNSFVGYGCTYKTKRKTRLAILPIGYYDGYDRRIGNKGYVLIHGKRAAVRGRVCMNIIMVDITDISRARVEDDVILLGKNLPAEQMAEWVGTINYEITTRINENIPRIAV